jgi:hypothetical protein
MSLARGDEFSSAKSKVDLSKSLQEYPVKL